MSCQEINVVPFDKALADGHVEVVTEEIDKAFLDAAAAQAFPGPRDAKILYSPLHGVGAEAVMPLLQRDGFKEVEVYGPHEEKSGDFPNVPGHVSNPENKAVFDAPIELAKSKTFDLILATDPDCDRLGVAAPKTTDSAGEWGTFDGNQIGSLLAEYILSKRKAAGTLTADHYVVKTLVTSELIGRIAESYGVRCVGDLLVGFKYIAEVMDREGPDQFVFGTEESHGYLVGQYARDKDGAVACMLMSELAAELKAEGKSLHTRLADLHRQHGYHKEALINLVMEGSEGIAAMQRLMKAFRETIVGRNRSAPDPRLWKSNEVGRREWRKIASFRASGRFDHSGLGRRRKLRRSTPERYRAEDQIVRLYPCFACGIARFGGRRANDRQTTRRHRKRHASVCKTELLTLQPLEIDGTCRDTQADLAFRSTCWIVE